MKNRITMATLAVAAVLSGAVAAPQAAFARHHHRHYYGQSRNYSQPRYTARCSGGDGAVGTIGGGVGGALIGNAIGGDTLGTVVGGVGGALLGRTLDKNNTRHRNGC
jgi:outer membrane lipoprotein SlyB